MPLRGEAAEDLVQMDLGTAGERVLPVLPVDQEQPERSQSRPIRRASASSTPFTNFALCALP